MKTKEERIQEQEDTLKRVQAELKAIREEPDTPKIQLKDKHVYRREDGEIVFMFRQHRTNTWKAIRQSDGMHNTDYQDDGTDNCSDSHTIVECIGKIGVVDRDFIMRANSNESGRYSVIRAYNADNLTGKPIA